MDSSPPPTSPAPIEKPEVEQEVKQDTAKKDQSITDSFATNVTGISAIEDILQLLKVLYCLSTTSAYDFGERGMC